MRSGLYVNFGVNRKAPRMTGVWNTTFQNALQSTSRIRLRHQSGPPPCSAPKMSVPALAAETLPAPFTLAEPVAASASAANTTPAQSQSFRRCIDPSLLGFDLRARTTWLLASTRTHSSPHCTNRDLRTERELAVISRTNHVIRKRRARRDERKGQLKTPESGVRLQLMSRCVDGPR